MKKIGNSVLVISFLISIFLGCENNKTEDLNNSVNNKKESYKHQFEVGEEGGTFTFYEKTEKAENITLEFTTGAVTKNLTLTIKTIESDKNILKKDTDFAGPVFNIGPSGTQFQKPVKLTLPFENDADAITVCSGENDDNCEIIRPFSINEEEKTISIFITHLSIFFATNTQYPDKVSTNFSIDLHGIPCANFSDENRGCPDGTCFGMIGAALSRFLQSDAKKTIELAPSIMYDYQNIFEAMNIDLSYLKNFDNGPGKFKGIACNDPRILPTQDIATLACQIQEEQYNYPYETHEGDINVFIFGLGCRKSMKYIRDLIYIKNRPVLVGFNNNTVADIASVIADPEQLYEYYLRNRTYKHITDDHGMIAYGVDTINNEMLLYESSNPGQETIIKCHDDTDYQLLYKMPNNSYVPFQYNMFLLYADKLFEWIHQSNIAQPYWNEYCNSDNDHHLKKSCNGIDCMDIHFSHDPDNRPAFMDVYEGLYGSVMPNSINPDSSDLCDGIDNNCNDIIDEGCNCIDPETQQCGTDVGECKKGINVCVDGQWSDCEGGVGPEDESCDLKDNDCDGQADEDISQPCSTDCGSGSKTCQNGQWTDCSASQPTTESCDNYDNDCDGMTDEGCDCVDGETRPCTTNYGSGTEYCINGRWVNCNAPTDDPCPQKCADAGLKCGDYQNCNCGTCTGCTDRCLDDGKCHAKEQVSHECKPDTGNIHWKDSCGDWKWRKEDCEFGCMAGNSDCNPDPNVGVCDEGDIEKCNPNCGRFNDSNDGQQECTDGYWGQCLPYCLGDTKYFVTPAESNSYSYGSEFNGVKIGFKFAINIVCGGIDILLHKLFKEEGVFTENKFANDVDIVVTNTNNNQSTDRIRVNAYNDTSPYFVWQQHDIIELEPSGRTPFKVTVYSPAGCTDCSIFTTGADYLEWCGCHEGDRQTCGKDTGECYKGERTCSDGEWGRCRNSQGPTGESCDNKDNDCDGSTDEDLRQSCSNECGSGEKICQNGSWSECNAPQPTSEVCDNRDNDCNNKIDDELTKSCSTNCGEGTQSCHSGQWSQCAPIQAPTETCDNTDNDCDGETDENLTQSCSTDCGVGTEICQNGNWISCDAPQPQAEVCDNKDNDCDGQTDESLTQSCSTNCGSGTEICQSGNWINCDAPQPQTETCDNQDNDCDGEADENLTQSCSTDCGVGAETCQNGNWISCDAPQPQTEVCDNKDNDCDGQTDESLTQSCSTDCGSGNQVCQNGNWSTCDAVQPILEICDNQDNDCDGEADENLTQSCSTDCGSGLEVCINGNWDNCTAVQPQTETCDGVDNDCDGETDEECPCIHNQTQVCGIDTGECKQGIQTCSYGQWGSCEGAVNAITETCDNKDNDCNNLVDDNLNKACSTDCGSGNQICQTGQWSECDAVQPTSEICDNQDNDCDGSTDESLAQSCSTTCGSGVITCANGNWSDCSAAQPQTEVCDGIDNDCDNSTDEGCDCIHNQTESCGIDTGECQKGVKTCSYGEWSSCKNSINAATEICDNKDNDCDGQTDESLTQSCSTNCGSGTETCQNGNWVNCNAIQPQEELCDGHDNNCDGETDEGCEYFIFPKFVPVIVGTFTMGSPTSEPRDPDEDQHEVTLTYNFEIQETEVTQKQFDTLMGYNPSQFVNCGDNCPVETVSWHETLSYCNALSHQKGLDECFDCTGSGKETNCTLKSQYTKPQDCPGYRLPTEAEWEYAARAGTTTAFHNGGITNHGMDPIDDNLNEIGWFGGNSTVAYEGGADIKHTTEITEHSGTHPVSSKLPNTWSLYDISGNVSEWCWDWYGPDYYNEGAMTDPIGPSDPPKFHRIMRGGNWDSYAWWCRTAGRSRSGIYGNYLGFRPVRSLHNECGNDTSCALFMDVNAGVHHTCAINTDGFLFCWGSNGSGSIGNGTDTPKMLHPIKISNDKWRSISAGRSSTCGIKQDGTLWCWGVNDQGQVGDGNGGYGAKSTIPVQVGTDKWLNVIATGNQNCGLKQDSTLWCWGQNHYGQIGDGTIINRMSPVQIGGDKWSFINSKWGSTCAIKKSDNSLWCWGYNNFGQIGNGISGYTECPNNGSHCKTQKTPIQIGSDSWFVVSSGGLHTCGLKQNGILWCWGNNSVGQLGNGKSGHDSCPTTAAADCENISTPIQIGNDYWSYVDVNNVNTCALKQDGTLWCWGNNLDGQLGHIKAPQNTPIKMEIDLCSHVSVGREYICAIKKTDYTLWCWGLNDQGQVGNGLTSSTYTPTHVSCLVNEEVCDGIDNDCDGQTDEGFTETCGTGACKVTINHCVDGQLLNLTCTPGQASAEEACSDRKDNDCDGSTDEGCPPCLGTCGVGQQQCWHDNYRECKADAYNCPYWTTFARCPSPNNFCSGKVCASSPSDTPNEDLCKGKCNSEGAALCDGGDMQYCLKDKTGCMDWSMSTGCFHGYCKNGTVNIIVSEGGRDC